MEQKNGKLFFGLRFQTALLLLLISLGILSFDYITLFRQNIYNSVNREISQTTQLVAFEQESWIGRTNWLLQLLANFSMIKEQGTADCAKLLNQVVAISPYYINLGLVKPDGDVFCSALPLKTPVNLSNKAWFRQATNNKSFSIGEYNDQSYQKVGFIKKASIDFGYPIVDKNNEVQSIIFLTLDLDWVKTLFDRVRFPEGSSLFLVDSQGLILTTNLEAEQWVGKRAPETKVLEEVLNFKSGTIEGVDVNGAKTIYAYTPLTGIVGRGIFYIIGIPSKFITANIQQLIFQDVLVFAITLIVLILIRIIKQRIYKTKNKEILFF